MRLAERSFVVGGRPDGRYVGFGGSLPRYGDTGTRFSLLLEPEDEVAALRSLAGSFGGEAKMGGGVELLDPSDWGCGLLYQRLDGSVGEEPETLETLSSHS